MATHRKYSLGTTVPSAGGPVGTAGTCAGAPGSVGWLPIRVTFRWLSASSGCSSAFCGQVLGSACTGPTAIAPLSPRSPHGSLQPRRHALCCSRQVPIGPWNQLPQPVRSLRPPPPPLLLWYLARLLVTCALLCLHCHHRLTHCASLAQGQAQLAVSVWNGAVCRVRKLGGVLSHPSQPQPEPAQSPQGGSVEATLALCAGLGQPGWL